MTQKKNRRSWTADQKQAIAAEARRRRAAGEPFKSITAAVGVLEGSLRLWMDQFPERVLKRVQVVDDEPISGAISLLTPDGFLFDGLEISSAARLWAEIR